MSHSSARPTSAIGPKALWVAACKSDRHVSPHLPVYDGSVSFHRQQLASVRLVRDSRSELADLRARVRRSHEGRDCSLSAQFSPQDFASDGHGRLRYDAAANESLRPAQSGSIGTPRTGSGYEASIPIKLGEGHPGIAQPSQGIEGDETAACPQTTTCRSLLEASARVRTSGGVPWGPSRRTSRLPSTRIAGPVPLTTTTPFLTRV